VGKELWQVGLFAGPKAYHEALATVRDRGYARHEDVTLEGADGKRLELEIVGSLFDVDGRRIVQFAVRDVSQRRQLERTTIHAEAMEELNRRKDEFLAMLSHELRNPLAAVVNAVHMQKLSADPDPMRRQARDIIERQIGRLTHLVDDLLEVSRITTGRVQLHQEFLDARHPVEQGAESLRPLVRDRGQTLELSLPEEALWIYADAGRVEQVVVNLLHNAAKYTERGGKIAVSLAREGEEAVLRVRDNGAGISPQLLPRIFDLFTQAERTLDRSEGGLGVGLTVVQRVVQLHGGRVEARSDGPGKGSEFAVHLPIVIPPPQVLSTSAAGEGATRPLRILVVDDNRDAADTAGLLLRRSGHEVRVEYSGATVKGATLEFLPDVVLLDLGLPGLDGYEVAALLRADPRLAAVHLVALSGYGQEADKARTKDAGFVAHLVKPVEPAQLRETLVAVTKRPLRS
jgi:signal transduction histidine kinase/CheY-like chemotaxis protein